MHSPRNTALLFLLGALLVGGAVGFSMERWVLSPTRTAPRTSERMREQLARELDLSADQRARFDGILARRDARLDTLMGPIRAQMETVRPQYRAIRDSARVEIRALLSASQQRDFDRFIAEMRAEESRRDSSHAARRAGSPGLPGASGRPAMHARASRDSATH